MTIDMTVSLLHMRGMHVQYHVPVNLFINSYSCTVARYRARGRIPSRLESWASEFRSHTPRAQTPDRETEKPSCMSRNSNSMSSSTTTPYGSH